MARSDNSVTGGTGVVVAVVTGVAYRVSLTLRGSGTWGFYTPCSKDDNKNEHE